MFNVFTCYANRLMIMKKYCTMDGSPCFMDVLKTIIQHLHSKNKELKDKIRDICNACYAQGYEKYCLEQRVSELEEENK